LGAMAAVTPRFPCTLCTSGSCSSACDKTWRGRARGGV
jgi:hypothetical protein